MQFFKNNENLKLSKNAKNVPQKGFREKKRCFSMYDYHITISIELLTLPEVRVFLVVITNTTGHHKSVVAVAD